MIVIGQNVNNIPLSLNQYNSDFNLNNANGFFDKDNFHYVFKITNDLTSDSFIFQPNLDGDWSNAGDFWWGSSMNMRMNDFKWIISPTQSNLTNGIICLTGSNWDDSQWTYGVYVNSGSPLNSGTPSISATASLLETGRLYFDTSFIGSNYTPPAPEPPTPSNADWTSVYLSTDGGFITTITDIGPFGAEVYSLYLFNGGMTFSDWQTVFGPTVDNDDPPLFGAIPDKVWMSEDEAFSLYSEQWIVAQTDSIFYLITFTPAVGGGYDLVYHGSLSSPCGIGTYDVSSSDMFDDFIISGTCS